MSDNTKSDNNQKEITRRQFGLKTFLKATALAAIASRAGKYGYDAYMPNVKRVKNKVKHSESSGLYEKVHKRGLTKEKETIKKGEGVNYEDSSPTEQTNNLDEILGNTNGNILER